LTLLGLVLRLFRLEYQSLWGDELFSASVAGLPFSAMVDRLVHDFVHPPLHYFVLHAIYSVTEAGSLEGRLLSAVLGTAAVLVIYFAGQRFFGRRSGVMAAGLMAVSQLAVMYSQELRMYSLQLLLASLTLFFFQTAISERRSWAWWAFVVTAALAIYTHYYSAFLVAPLFGLAAVYRKRVPLTWTFLGALGVGLLFVPWLASGVLEAAANSPKSAPAVQPAWFRATWTTLFDSLNQYNNGGLTSVFGDGQAPISYLAGAALFSAPALATLGVFKGRARPRPVAWGLGALATLAYNAVAGGATAGLVLTALISSRAAQLTVRTWRGESVSSKVIGDIAWAMLLLFAGAVAVWQQAPGWILFVLGLLLGEIFYQNVRNSLDSNSETEDSSSATFARMTLAVTWLVPLAVPLAAGIVGVQYDVRYTLAGLPAYLILVAHGLSMIRVPRLRALVIGACGVFSIIALRVNYFVPYKENWRDALSVVSDRYSEGDCVAVLPWGISPEMPVAWTLYGYARRHPDLSAYPVGQIERAARDCGRIWTISYRRVRRARFAADSIRTVVQTTHSESEHHDFFWTDVGLYERRK
jgi:4-amino-4-deoxy-L-arabinose transferase-like glycosyltransferase